MAEGFPPDSRYSDIMAAARIKHDRRLTELSGMAMAICEAVRVNIGGGTTADVVKPLYSVEEWRTIERAQAEAREREAQIRQVAILERMAKTWQTTNN